MTEAERLRKALYRRLDNLNFAKYARLNYQPDEMRDVVSLLVIERAFEDVARSVEEELQLGCGCPHGKHPSTTAAMHAAHPEVWFPPGLLRPDAPPLFLDPSPQWETPKGDTMEEVIGDAAEQVVTQYREAIDKLAGDER